MADQFEMGGGGAFNSTEVQLVETEKAFKCRNLMIFGTVEQ